MSDYIKCPFCGEDDFDLIGLKNHFERGHCDVYNETESPIEERERMRLEAEINEHRAMRGDISG